MSVSDCSEVNAVLILSIILSVNFEAKFYKPDLHYVTHLLHDVYIIAPVILEWSYKSNIGEYAWLFALKQRANTIKNHSTLNSSETLVQ